MNETKRDVDVRADLILGERTIAATEANWWVDPEAVLAFARVLHIQGDTFGTDIDRVLSYFEKPWKWTPELRKYQAWLRDPANQEHVARGEAAENLPEDFFA